MTSAREWSPGSADADGSSRTPELPGFPPLAGGDGAAHFAATPPPLRGRVCGTEAGSARSEQRPEFVRPVVVHHGLSSVTGHVERLLVARVSTPGAVLLGAVSEDDVADSVDRSLARFGRSPLREKDERPGVVRRAVADARLVHGVHVFERVHSVRDAQGWGDFLAPYFAAGACNISGTYSDAYGYSHGLMVARNVIKDFAAFRRDLGRSSATFCQGVEIAPQGWSSGRPILHFHALVSGSFTASELADVQEAWGDGRGWADVKAVTNRKGCVEYAAKHLLKQGAQDNFEFQIFHKYSSRHERRLAGGGGSQSSKPVFSEPEARFAGVMSDDTDGLPIRVVQRVSAAR